MTDDKVPPKAPVKELPQPPIDVVAAAANKWLVPALLKQKRKESKED